MHQMDPKIIESLKKRVTDNVDGLRDDLIQMGRTIFENPEVAFEEHLVCRLLADWLADNGFAVETGVANLRTAFKATSRQVSAGRTVAFLAEYDALPQLGHACGHNIIATASVGAAIAVGSLMDSLPGVVLAIGTPAEEYGGGKITMVRHGVFEGVDAAMMVHPSTRTCVHMSALASETLDVEFFGQAAHAASYPEKGLNALDALVLSYANISALRQQVRSDARIHGIITNGGEASNIIPAYASGRFQVRAQDDAYLDQLLERVLDCFRAGALATGTRLEYKSPERRYSAMRNNETLASAFAANLRQLGIVVEDRPPAGAFGSTDMGNVSQVVPSIHPSIAIADKGIALHSSEFATAANSERGYQAIIVAAKALAMTAVDMLADGALAAKVKKEFVDSE